MADPEIYILPSGLSLSLRKWKLSEIRELTKANKKNWDEKIKKITQDCVISIHSYGPYESLGAINNGKMNWDKLLEGDWTALLFLARAKTHGELYDSRMKCTDCGNIDPSTINILEDLPVYNLSDNTPEMAKTRDSLARNDRTITINYNDDLIKELTFKILNIAENSAYMKKQDNNLYDDYTYLEKKIIKITTPSGQVYSNQTIENVLPVKRFLDELDADYAYNLVEDIDAYEFGLNLVVDAECSQCGNTFEGGVDITANFFRPQKTRKKNGKKKRVGGRGLKVRKN